MKHALVLLAGFLSLVALPSSAKDPSDHLEVWGPQPHQRGRIGIEVLPMSSQLRKAFGVPEDRGVLVGRVAADSPAAEADIRAGDVLLRVGDRHIDHPGTLIRAARTAPSDEPLEIVLWRDGAEQTLTVTPRGRAWPTLWDAESRLEPQLRSLRERIAALEKRMEALQRQLGARDD